jgi:hypothetical protein
MLTFLSSIVAGVTQRLRGEYEAIAQMIRDIEGGTRLRPYRLKFELRDRGVCACFWQKASNVHSAIALGQAFVRSELKSENFQLVDCRELITYEASLAGSY